MATSDTPAADKAPHSMLNTNFPVDLPDMPELRLPKLEFEAYVKSALLSAKALETKTAENMTKEEILAALELPIHTKPAAEVTAKTVEIADVLPDPATPEPGSRFMDGLLASQQAVPTLDERDGKMLTENGDVAFRTSGEALVDLFAELETVISGARLVEVLEAAWTADSDATLKIIWNARSIHLGKSDRITFYRAVGWLAEEHPATLLTNLPWLVRPLIQKKTPKAEQKKDSPTQVDQAETAELVEMEDADSDFEIVDGNDSVDDEPRTKKPRLDDAAELTEFDVKYGVAHGYWKDLLNILALAANDELKATGDPRSVLNVAKPEEKKVKPHQKDWTQGRRKLRTADRHARAVAKLDDDPFYKALHVTVARLFADQLKTDYARLQSANRVEIKRISLAAKWAPSHKGMHDQHTCIVSSIAELLYPFNSVTPDGDLADRTLYLKHAREAYQLKLLSPLRKALDIVERSITANAFDAIKYDRVPSLAMKQYTPLFARKDFDRFDQYIDKVAAGSAKISGATLLPSTLVKAVSNRVDYFARTPAKKAKGTDALVAQKFKDLEAKAADGQWNALVQRIKDNGTLASSVAVCDVSGSMTHPRFPDGTCPMDSAIGLALLLAEITAAPFGGAFITFDAVPHIMHAGGAGDKRSFGEKVAYIENSPWGGNTDFVAVFESLILPLALELKLKPEEMVKQVFVFSDMQFDAANDGTADWGTSYERIERLYKKAGYEVPRLIFWNLAGGRAGHGQYAGGSSSPAGAGGGGDEVAPKPVTAAEAGTALVSGYSQGQLKMFLDSGTFEDAE
ncbi:hypothetical protein LTR53_009425, partial [Teratosphaeriaceae sp. CCFEE 6253]